MKPHMNKYQKEANDTLLSIFVKDNADKPKHTEVECRASMEVHTTQIAVCPICGQRYYRRRCYGRDAWAQENHGRRR